MKLQYTQRLMKIFFLSCGDSGHNDRQVKPW